MTWAQALLAVLHDDPVEAERLLPPMTAAERVTLRCAATVLAGLTASNPLPLGPPTDFVCDPCSQARHHDCLGACDCQHAPRHRTPDDPTKRDDPTRPDATGPDTTPEEPA